MSLSSKKGLFLYSSSLLKSGSEALKSKLRCGVDSISMSFMVDKAFSAELDDDLISLSSSLLVSGSLAFCSFLNYFLFILSGPD